MAAMQAMSLRAACGAGSTNGAMLRSVRYTPATTSVCETSHTVMACVSATRAMTQSVPRAVASDARSVIGKFCRSRATCSRSTSSRSHTGQPQRVGGITGSRGSGLVSEGVMELRGGQAQALGCQQRSAAAVDAQLRKDGRHMHTHRVLAQSQVAGDHLVGSAGAQQ